jgi:hypothetical protein
VQPNLHKKKFHTENNTFVNAQTVRLYQDLYYDRPRIIDEEVKYYLQFTIIDTSAALAKRIIDLTTDSLIINTRYTVFKNMRHYHGNKVSGHIEIIKWGDNEILLRENIHATIHELNETREFIGKHLFKKYYMQQ